MSGLEGVAIPPTLSVDIGPAVDKQLNNLGASVRTSGLESISVVTTLGVDICPAVEQ
jgi:hypothetical protein